MKFNTFSLPLISSLIFLTSCGGKSDSSDQPKTPQEESSEEGTPQEESSEEGRPSEESSEEGTSNEEVVENSSEDRFLQVIEGTSGTPSDDNVTLLMRQNFQVSGLYKKGIPRDLLFMKCIEKEAGLGRAEVSKTSSSLKWNLSKFDIKGDIWSTYRYSDNNFNQLIGQKAKPRGDGLTEVVYLRRGRHNIIWGERVLRASVANTNDTVKQTLLKYQERYEAATAEDNTGVESTRLALSYFACHYQTQNELNVNNIELPEELKNSDPGKFSYKPEPQAPTLMSFNDFIKPFMPSEQYWKIDKIIDKHNYSINIRHAVSRVEVSTWMPNGTPMTSRRRVATRDPENFKVGSYWVYNTDSNGDDIKIGHHSEVILVDSDYVNNIYKTYDQKVEEYENMKEEHKLKLQEHEEKLKKYELEKQKAREAHELKIQEYNLKVQSYIDAQNNTDRLEYPEQDNLPLEKDFR